MKQFGFYEIEFNYEKLSGIMYAWRMSHGWTQVECDELCGFSSSLWNRYERCGKRDVRTSNISMGTLLAILNVIFDDPEWHAQVLMELFALKIT